jgi:short subunit dehydrogenase-like uncharacterized protein
MPETERADAPARVVLVGGTGFTGGLVARALGDAGLPFLLTGRDPARLRRRAGELGGGPPTRRVDVTEPATLAGCLRPGDVVVDCAGPFTELGEAVVETCVRAGAHVVDTTGEQRYMMRIRDGWHARARRAGVAVVNALAFEYALGDCTAELAADGLVRPLRRLEVVYGWRGDAAVTTPGTRASIVRVMARRGWALADGEWRLEPTARRRGRARLPGGAVRDVISFPAGEVVTVPRHLDVRTVRGWLVTGSATARAASFLSPVLPPAARLLTPILDRLARRGPEGPTEEQRRRGRFDIVVTAEGDDGELRTLGLSGRDPYGLTATLAARGAGALLARSRGDGGPSGVLAPAELLDARELLEGLRSQGLEVAEAPGAGPPA